MAMLKTNIYRRVDPELVIAVWQKMDTLLGRKQQGNAIERFMSALMKDLKKSENSVRKLLEDMVSDGLLESVSAGGSTNESVTTGNPHSCISLPGSHNGQRISYYMPDFNVPPPQHLPEDSPSYQHHDWYCFQCHKAGAVVDCTECWRVYHIDCIRDYLAKKNAEQSQSNAAVLNSSRLSEDDSSWLQIQQRTGKTKKTSSGTDSTTPSLQSGSDFVCHVCQSRPKCEFSRKQIRKLLDFATFASRKQDLWKHKFSRYGFNGDICRCEYLTYRYVDTDLLQNKIFDGRYTSLEEFLIDVQVLVHGVCLLHGPFSSLADDARFMARSIESEVMEANLCTDCYINSKARLNDWISKPCKPPHDLIWAQMPSPHTGISTLQHNGDEDKSYWPAKILLEKDDGYEVRFFGGTHDRRFVPRRATFSFSYSHAQVPIKRGNVFDRAWHEVQKLQDNVNEGYYTHSSGESDLPPSDDDYTDDMYLQLRRTKQRQNRANLPSTAPCPVNIGADSFSSHIGKNDVSNTRHKKKRHPSGSSSGYGAGPTFGNSKLAPNSQRHSLVSPNPMMDATASILNRLNSRAPVSVELHHQHTLHPADDKGSSPSSSPLHYSSGALKSHRVFGGMGKLEDNHRMPRRQNAINGMEPIPSRDESILSSSSEVSSSIQRETPEILHSRSGRIRRPSEMLVRNRRGEAESDSSDENESASRDLSSISVSLRGAKKRTSNSPMRAPRRARVVKGKNTLPNSTAFTRRPTLLPSSSSSVASSSNLSSSSSYYVRDPQRKQPVRPPSPTRTIDDDLSSLSDSDDTRPNKNIASRMRSSGNKMQASPRSGTKSTSKHKISTSSTGGGPSVSPARKRARQQSLSTSNTNNKVRNGKNPKPRRPQHSYSPGIHSNESDDSDATDRCSLGASNSYHPLLYPHQSPQRAVTNIGLSPPLDRSPTRSTVSAWPLSKSTECQTDPMQPEAPPIEYRKLPCDCEEQFLKSLKAQEEEEKANTERILRERREELENQKRAAVDKLVAETRIANQETCENLRRELENRTMEAVLSAKKRQWCRNCLKEAIYHCCWNTAYCSIACQQEHWHKEHKRACRRKR